MSDIKIARKANKKNIKEIAIKLNLEENDLNDYQCLAIGRMPGRDCRGWTPRGALCGTSQPG